MLFEHYFALYNYVPEYGMKLLDFLHISTYQENELFQDMQGFLFSALVCKCHCDKGLRYCNSYDRFILICISGTNVITIQYFYFCSVEYFNFGVRFFLICTTGVNPINQPYNISTFTF